MSIKLIAVDIDGTLLNSQRQVTPEVFQAIQDAKAAGVKVVIATGRPIPGVLPLLEELNLNQDGDYVITFNGGLVQETSTGNELIRETLSYEDYLDIEVLANKLGVLTPLLKMVSTQVIAILAATRFMSLHLFICRFTIVHLKR